MKQFFSISIFVFFLLLPLENLNAKEISSNSTPLVGSLLELMQSNDQEVSLGFMLLSVDMYDNAKLEKYIRENLNKNDPSWVTAIKMYTISQYTLSDEDSEGFITSIPHDKENFTKMITFESKITRHPGSKMLTCLLTLARNDAKPELQTMAIDKLDRIRPLADGWVGDFIRPTY